MNIKNEKLVCELLKSICVTPNLTGYEYIKDALSYLEDHPGKISLNKELYPAIAKQHNTSNASVERCLRTCINKISEYADTDILEDIFGSIIQNKPLTNKWLIYGLHDYLKI